MLEVRVRGLAVPRDFFPPELQRVPVDERDDAQRDEWILEREAREVRIGQRDAAAGERGEEDRVVAFAVVDVEVELFAGDAELEVEGEIKRGEGRDVKMFRHDTVETSVGAEVFRAEEEGLLFAEGVADFGDGAERSVLGIEAEVERDGVEDVAEDAAVREEEDAGVGGEWESLRGDPGEHALLGGEERRC